MRAIASGENGGRIQVAALGLSILILVTAWLFSNRGIMSRPVSDRVQPATLRLIAVLAAIGASVTLGLGMLDWELRPLDVPSAMVLGGLYLQPAVLLMLPRRRAALDLAAGVIATFLVLGSLLIPYGLATPWLVAGAVLSLVSGVALWLNSYSKSKGDAALALLAVILTAGAMSRP